MRRISDFLDYPASFFVEDVRPRALPVSFYRNLDANWELTHDIPLSVMTMPTGFIAGARDGVIAMSPGGITFMEQNLPDFRGATLIDGAGHWNQQERPAETNAALLAFLADALG